MVQSLPEGFNTLSPHLIVKDVAAAIEFYQKAFGAQEVCRLVMPGTTQIFHAGLQMGNSRVMLGGEFQNEQCVAKSPASLGGTPVSLYFYVENVDEAFQKAIESGAQEMMRPTDMFWGDRYSKVRDPFGHEWSLASPVHELSQETMQDAAAEFFSQPQPVR